MADYTMAELQHYRESLPHLRELLVKNPKSLALINGIAAIEKRLGVPGTIEPIDPLKFIAAANQIHALNIR